ncbi:probable BOI-related E3 ubiquitin-protein ligase 3 [Impatiens glandulifera]|uniref:probable BOI-related E3 ubiquitin-protein ligase 3 n=1 Tax=Impatiens glandulifera TaxID=253017 RepID=UPI001FB14446|nr:probable BOI-related E3 ubiquitin-protein ligase 3 [Impatiens glandulifera]
MANHLFQQSTQQQQQQQSDIFKNFYNTHHQMSPPVADFIARDLPDRSQHPPYIPSFHVVGLAPYPVPATDASDGLAVDFPLNYGFESRRKRLKELDFLDNNTQFSPVDFIQTRSVSTGLGLSLDNGRLASSGDSSPFLGVIGNELSEYNADLDGFLRVQVEQLRQKIIEKVQANQMETISYLEQKVIEKLKQKEEEVENVNKKNMELELQIQQLAMEASMWQQNAKYKENTINHLHLSLQQIFARIGDSKEGYGDSEVEDTASCFDGEKRMMCCKVCNAKVVSMLLLPCKHLCVCIDCESGISFCPICQSTKIMSLEVHV